MHYIIKLFVIISIFEDNTVTLKKALRCYYVCSNPHIMFDHCPPPQFQAGTHTRPSTSELDPKWRKPEHYFDTPKWRNTYKPY